MKYETWVSKLRALRESRELRQEDVAKKIRISRSQYSAIESGQSIVNYNHLVALADAFNMTPSEIMALRGVSVET